MRIFLGFIIGLVIAGAIAVAAMKFAWGDIKDMGERDHANDVTRSVAATDFDRINIAGVFELKTTVGSDYSIELKGSEEGLDRTTVEVRDGVLFLDTHERGENGKRRLIKHSIKATISMPALNGFDVAGVVDGDISGIDAEDFKVDVSGVGDVNLSGSCGSLEADVSGVGDLDAEELHCRKVKVEVSGVGRTSVFASEAVDAELNGIGEIEIYGSPAEVSKSKSSPIGRIVVH